MSKLLTVLSSTLHELICVNLPPVREGALVCPVLQMRELSRKKNSSAYSFTAGKVRAQIPTLVVFCQSPTSIPHPQRPPFPCFPCLSIHSSLFLWQGPWETTSCLKRSLLSPTRPQTHFPCILLGLLSGLVNNTPLFGTPIQNQLRTT